MAKITFWFSLAAVFYVYAGYPLLLVIWRALAGRAVAKAPLQPFVTLILIARNERAAIAEKVENCLQQEYPRELVQFIVSLDGPTDGTEAVVADYLDRGVTLLHCPEHQGKAAAINRALRIARGEIVVFVDARQRLEATALRELVSNFADASIGAVSGELILESAREDGANGGAAVGLYWRYEKWLRAMESQIHSTLGVSGALYAIRRSLSRPLPADTILDDVAMPMRAVLDGKRVIFEPAAKAYDSLPTSPRLEFARKVRTLAGNFQLLERMPALLLPWRNPVFIQFLSHKVGRLMVPYCLIGLLISNLFLREPFYLFTLALQLTWYLLAVAGGIAARFAVSRELRPSESVTTRVRRLHEAHRDVAVHIRADELGRNSEPVSLSSSTRESSQESLGGAAVGF